jgi:hypothetical protein
VLRQGPLFADRGAFVAKSFEVPVWVYELAPDYCKLLEIEQYVRVAVPPSSVAKAPVEGPPWITVPEQRNAVVPSIFG